MEVGTGPFAEKRSSIDSSGPACVDVKDSAIAKVPGTPTPQIGNSGAGSFDAASVLASPRPGATAEVAIKTLNAIQLDIRFMTRHFSLVRAFVAKRIGTIRVAHPDSVASSHLITLVTYHPISFFGRRFRSIDRLLMAETAK